MNSHSSPKNIISIYQNIDNLGVVVRMCDEIGLSDIIDQACGTQVTNKHLTFGEKWVGFCERPLSLKK